MSKKQQLLTLIASIEDADLKAKLEATANGAFVDVENIKNDAIESRDKAKAKLTAKTEMLETIQRELKLDDDFSITDITDKIKNNANADEIEARFKTDLDTVRAELLTSQTANAELQIRFDDTLFTNSINSSGELNNFVNDAMAQKMILGEYRDKTILEDGKLYKKDEITGKIATDAITGDKMGIDTVTKDILGSISDIYKNPDVIAQGGGSRQTVSTASKTAKRNEMSNEDKARYINEHGSDAYLQLKN